MTSRLRPTLVALAVAATITFTLWPAEAHAQRGRAVGRGGGRVVVLAPFYRGYGFYDPFFWGGWGGWGPGWGMGWYPPFGVYGRPVGSARLRITPKQAEVYVDGYLAGSVDDFDGVFQRLDVTPGEHEVTIYLEGYRPLVERRYFQPGATIEIHQQLVPLAPGDVTPPRPVAGVPTPGPAGAGGPGADDDPNAAPPARGPWGRSTPMADGHAVAEGYGTLAIRIQPRDAILVIDGEEWAGPEDEGPVHIELSAGAHEIEVRRDGSTTYQRTVQVRAGRTLALNVSLR